MVVSRFAMTRWVVLALVINRAFVANGAGQIAPKGTGFRAEYLAELTVAEDHVLRLAEAIPAHRYGWRPAAGVRSISEVFLHIAGSNFNLPRVLGVATREGMVGRDYEQINGGEERGRRGAETVVCVFAPSGRATRRCRR
jgi:hypothetical protein